MRWLWQRVFTGLSPISSLFTKKKTSSWMLCITWCNISYNQHWQTLALIFIGKIESFVEPRSWINFSQLLFGNARKCLRMILYVHTKKREKTASSWLQKSCFSSTPILWTRTLHYNFRLLSQLDHPHTTFDNILHRG